MRRLLYGTIRPISLLACLLPLIGAALTNHLSFQIIWALLGAILAVGFANCLNNFFDRKIDQLNPNKHSLAKQSPLAVAVTSSWLAIGVELCLQMSGCNDTLLSVLFYFCFWYSALFGSLPIIKRLVVAGVVAGTAFLSSPPVTLKLKIWALFLGVYIYMRESGKDVADRYEDTIMRFAWLTNWSAFYRQLDWWCVSAPFLAALLYLTAVLIDRSSIIWRDAPIALGLTIVVWSYIQTRYRHRWYKMRMLHRTSGGRLGTVIALAGLLPRHTEIGIVILAVCICASIAYRSYLPCRLATSRLAIWHDAALWTSPIFLAMIAGGHYMASLTIVNLLIFIGVASRENWRLNRRLSLA